MIHQFKRRVTIR